MEQDIHLCRDIVERFAVLREELACGACGDEEIALCDVHFQDGSLPAIIFESKSAVKRAAIRVVSVIERFPGCADNYLSRMFTYAERL